MLGRTPSNCCLNSRDSPKKFKREGKLLYFLLRMRIALCKWKNLRPALPEDLTKGICPVDSKCSWRSKLWYYIHLSSFCLALAKPMKILPLYSKPTVRTEIRGRPGFLDKVSEHGSSMASVAGTSASRLSRYCNALPHLLVVVSDITCIRSIDPDWYIPLFLCSSFFPLEVLLFRL
ncbi:Uncharacterized protein HZ326_23097 [Fusarium oxysporum f. sp. albedinis]|nr:Uncharacterized protein HZ326_23097 [Fusarium oxysporum f. sp. albedinis]